MEEFLLNPNVSYLLLVIGLLLAMTALVSPGTGIAEIGAFFALLLAGWGVYNIPINYWALPVLLVGAIAFILALRKKLWLVYLAIAIGTLIIGSAFLFRGEDWRPAVNPVLTVIVSALLGGFMWIAVTKSLEAALAQPEHDLSRLIGALGEAKTEVYNEGTVQVAGELWSAHSDTQIKAGAEVRVVAREGFLLQVEPVEQPR